MSGFRVVVSLDIEYGWACVYVCIHMHTTHIHTYIDVFTGGLCPSSGFLSRGACLFPIVCCILHVLVWFVVICCIYYTEFCVCREILNTAPRSNSEKHCIHCYLWMEKTSA